MATQVQMIRQWQQALQDFVECYNEFYKDNRLISEVTHKPSIKSKKDQSEQKRS